MQEDYFKIYHALTAGLPSQNTAHRGRTTEVGECLEAGVRGRGESSRRQGRHLSLFRFTSVTWTEGYDDELLSTQKSRKNVDAVATYDLPAPLPRPLTDIKKGEGGGLDLQIVKNTLRT